MHYTRLTTSIGEEHIDGEGGGSKEQDIVWVSRREEEERNNISQYTYNTNSP